MTNILASVKKQWVIRDDSMGLNDLHLVIYTICFCATVTRLTAPFYEFIFGQLRMLFDRRYQPKSFMATMDWDLLYWAFAGLIMGLTMVVLRKKRKL